MSELILKLNRTVFLPPGSPNIGSVANVTGDLREVRCGMSSDYVYCLGELDVLIDYVSCQGGGGLFGDGKQCVGQNEWQALLTLPFHIRDSGTLPENTAYRVELGELEWNIVTSRAIELSTTVIINEENMPEAAEEPEREDTEWRMVSLNEERPAAMKPLSSLPIDKRPIEIVGLGNEELESNIHDAIMKALAATEEVLGAAMNRPADAAAGAEQHLNGSFTISAVFPQFEQTGAGDEEAAEFIEAAREAGAEAEFVEAAIEGGESKEFAQTAMAAGESAEIAAETMEAGEDEEPEWFAAAKAMAEEPVQFTETPAADTPEWQPIAPAVSEIDAGEPEIVVMSAQEIAAETAVIARKQKKRRFNAVPNLFIEANNNDIDVTAFKINIKL